MRSGKLFNRLITVTNLSFPHATIDSYSISTIVDIIIFYSNCVSVLYDVYLLHVSWVVVCQPLMLPA